MKLIFSWLAAAGFILATVPAGAAAQSGIFVLSGNFGRLGTRHRVDITSRLQDLCGSEGSSCDIWCSPTSFGGRDPGRHGLCRVVFRCPDGATRSTEAERDEPILMRCPAADGDERLGLTTPSTY